MTIPTRRGFQAFFGSAATSSFGSSGRSAGEFVDFLEVASMRQPLRVSSAGDWSGGFEPGLADRGGDSGLGDLEALSVRRCGGSVAGGGPPAPTGRA